VYYYYYSKKHWAKGGSFGSPWGSPVNYKERERKKDTFKDELLANLHPPTRPVPIEHNEKTRKYRAKVENKTQSEEDIIIFLIGTLDE